MSKRVMTKDNVISCAGYQQKICQTLALAMRKMWRFSFAQAGNNRSSTKTDLLHQCWETTLKDAFGDHFDQFDSAFEIITEKEDVSTQKTTRIRQIEDIFGGQFNVDMLLVHKSGPLKNQIHSVFLLKAPLTSLNKNRFNASGHTFGEIDRFYGNPDNHGIELVFVNLTPTQTFTVNSGSQFKPETVQYLGLNSITPKGQTVLQRLPKDQSLKSMVHEIHIPYQLNLPCSFDTISTETQLIDALNQSGTTVNVQTKDLKDLIAYVRQFMQKHHALFGGSTPQLTPPASSTEPNCKIEATQSTQEVSHEQ